MARPTKLTPEVQHRLCLHLQYGATEKMAAEAEGLHEDTLANWAHRYPAFFAAVTQAKAMARTEKLRLMHGAACRGSVPAMIWLLERLEPELFAAPAKRVEVAGPDGRDLTFTIALDRATGGQADGDQD